LIGILFHCFHPHGKQRNKSLTNTQTRNRTPIHKSQKNCSTQVDVCAHNIERKKNPSSFTSPPRTRQIFWKLVNHTPSSLPPRGVEATLGLLPWVGQQQESNDGCAGILTVAFFGVTLAPGALKGEKATKGLLRHNAGLLVKPPGGRGGSGRQQPNQGREYPPPGGASRP